MNMSMCNERIPPYGDLSLSVASVILQSIRREAPKIGGSFAVWGGLFSTFDCTLVALRKKVGDRRQQRAQLAAMSRLLPAMHDRQHSQHTCIRLGFTELAL